MAAGHLTNLHFIQRLVYQSTPKCFFRQAFHSHLKYTNAFILRPTKSVLMAHVRPFRLSRHSKEVEKIHQKAQADTSKFSGTQSKSSVSHSASTSLLNSLKNKSRTLSGALDVPIVSFSTGRVKVKELRENLGNSSSFSSNRRLFEFFSLREFVSTPSSFMLYGLSGLIPFSSVPVYMYMTSTYNPGLAYTQLVYGACILSFLGGVSWGNELYKPRNATLKSLGYSIFLPLLSWTGVLIYPNVIAFPIMISGVAFAGYVDTHLQPYPYWFKNLRFLLSLLVVLSLSGTFIFSFTLADTETEKE